MGGYVIFPIFSTIAIFLSSFPSFFSSSFSTTTDDCCHLVDRRRLEEKEEERPMLGGGAEASQRGGLVPGGLWRQSCLPKAEVDFAGVVSVLPLDFFLESMPKCFECM